MSILLNNKQVQNWINSLPLKVLDSGYAQLGREWQRRGVCSPYSRIYYIHHGEGYALHDVERTQLRPGHMYLIPIGLHFDYGCDTGIDQLYFHITITWPNGYDLFSRCSRIFELPIDLPEIDRLVALYGSAKLGDALGMAGCLYRDLVKFIAEASMEEKPAFAYSEMMQTLLPLIQQHLSARLTIRQRADEMTYSLSTLTKRFHAEMEMPLGQYIDTMVFQKAQQLLLFTDLSVAQIAEQLQFCDQAYFSRYFKLHQQETPSQYRRRLKAAI